MDRQIFQSHPEAFWQELVPEGTYDPAPAGGHKVFYPAKYPGGRELALPIRERHAGREALASLILNQASFAVADAFATELAHRVAGISPEVVVGMPTLGLSLAAEVARKLGHDRYVPLSTSRKFWYRDDLAVPMSSITSPGQHKHLYMDPRMLPLLEGRRVLLIDDVLSTGASIVAGCRLLRACNVEVVMIGAAMLQTARWRDALTGFDPALGGRIAGVIETPRLVPVMGGGWIEEERISGV